jgi:hypothetical protein
VPAILHHGQQLSWQPWLGLCHALARAVRQHDGVIVSRLPLEYCWDARYHLHDDPGFAAGPAATRQGWRAAKGQQHRGGFLLSKQALELFLSSRLALLRARLAAGADAQGDSGGGSLAALLSALAALVQDTICQASGAAANTMHMCPVWHGLVTQ